MTRAGLGRSVTKVVVPLVALAFLAVGCGKSGSATSSDASSSDVAPRVRSHLTAAGYSVSPLDLTERVAYRQPGGGLGASTRPLFVPGAPRPAEAFRVTEGATPATFNVFVFASRAQATAAVRAGVTALPYGAFVCPPPTCPRRPAQAHARVANSRVAVVGEVVYTGYSAQSAFRKLVAAGGRST